MAYRKGKKRQKRYLYYKDILHRTMADELETIARDREIPPQELFEELVVGPFIELARRAKEGDLDAIEVLQHFLEEAEKKTPPMKLVK